MLLKANEAEKIGVFTDFGQLNETLKVDFEFVLPVGDKFLRQMIIKQLPFFRRQTWNVGFQVVAAVCASNLHVDQGNI